MGFPGFFSPYYVDHQTNFTEAPPQVIHFRDENGTFRAPFVYGYQEKLDMLLRVRSYNRLPDSKFPVRLFAQGDSYKVLGLIPTNIHLIGTNAPGGYVYLFGTDSLGRDMFSRIIYGGRLSLLLGLIGQIITLTLGSVLGVASGYFGGWVDMVIQRTVEFLLGFSGYPAADGAVGSDTPAVVAHRCLFHDHPDPGVFGLGRSGAAGSGYGFVLARARICTRCQEFRDRRLADNDPPPAAQHNESHHRDSDARHSKHDSCRNGAVVFRPRPAPPP